MLTPEQRPGAGGDPNIVARRATTAKSRTSRYFITQFEERCS